MNWIVVLGGVLVAIGSLMIVVGGLKSDQVAQKEVLAKVSQAQQETKEVIDLMASSYEHNRVFDSKININDTNRELINLVNSIQSNHNSSITDDNFVNYISQFEKGQQALTDIGHWHEKLYANTFDRVAVICTIDQYKIQGFVSFFDLVTGKLLKIDKKSYSTGIVAVKYYDIHIDSLDYLVIIKYLSRTGTGVKEHAVKMYSINDDEINVALEKPYSAILSSDWHAFFSDVEFEQKNIVSITGGSVNIRTVGRVIYSKKDTEEEISIDLPEEDYFWNEQGKKFEQTSGRKVSKDLDLPSIYADYAEPKGEWFKNPGNISKGEFVSEAWDPQN